MDRSCKGVGRGKEQSEWMGWKKPGVPLGDWVTISRNKGWKGKKFTDMIEMSGWVRTV